MIGSVLAITQNMHQPVLSLLLAVDKNRPRFGLSPASVDVDKASRRLFPQEAREIQLTQGRLADCQLLAPLYGLSRNPEGCRVLAGSITLLSNGDFEVHFKKYPHRSVLVQAQEIMRQPLQDGRLPHVDSTPGVQVLEVAYARLMKLLEPEKYIDIPDDKVLGVYGCKQYHYDPETVLRDLTDWSVQKLRIRDDDGNENPDQTREAMASLARFARNPELFVIVAESNVLKPSPNKIRQLQDAFAAISGDAETQTLKRLIQTIFKPWELKDKAGPVDIGGKLPSWHVLSVESVNLDCQRIYLRDPHNTKIGLVLDFDDFFEKFRAITVATAEPAFREQETREFHG